MMDWIILPNEGIGPVRFGMTADEVMRAVPSIGPATHRDTQWDGSVRESRAVEIPSFTFESGKLTGIGLWHRTTGVSFDGMAVFQDRPEAVIRRLYDRNGRALYDAGDLLFVRLGVDTGGFWSGDLHRFLDPEAGDDEARTVALFAPGAFDAMLNEFRPWVLPEASA